MNNAFYIMLLMLCFQSCHQNYYVAENENTNNVLFYGADPSGKTDSSKAFQKALTEKHIVTRVPKGVYRLDKKLTVNKNLFLEAGVKLIRVKESNNNQPMIWLSKSYSTIEGENKRVLIESEIPLKEGIIKIGHENKSITNQNILYSVVKNLTIKGCGQTVEPSVGIFLYSAQNKGDSSTASFFHTVRDLVIEHINCAVYLKGFNNANSISNIILNRVGDEYRDAAIYLEGSMENRIYDIFHHYSRNATTLRLDNYVDGNGKVIAPSHNYIFGIVAEQGGDNAICTDIKAGRNNVIGVRCNTKLGNKTYDSFIKNKNKLIH
ncbi:MAG: hypothetical protein HKN51_17065 [Saprospiraceae bacterium]|nr:hypothetical protein [Saprospiraceae bacterium]